MSDNTRKRTINNSPRKLLIRRILEKLNKKKFGKLTCEICKKDLSSGFTTIDHIIPISKGGTGYIWNLQLAHGYCNEKKANEIYP